MKDVDWTVVVRQYGRLLEAAVTPDQRRAVQSDLSALQALISRDEAGWRFVSGGGCAPVVQKRLMEKVLENIKACAVTRRFVALLLQNRRVTELPSLIAFYEESLLRAGRDVAVVKTARALEPEQLRNLEKRLTPLCPAGVWVRPQVDPTLLGGGVLFWRDFMVDGSLKTFLHHMVA